ncbi:MAG: hypothetical protein ACHQ2Z_02640 [Elusimicrobiota bacterium]
MAPSIGRASRLLAFLTVACAPALGLDPIPARTAPAARSRIYFRYNGIDADYGKLAVVDSDDLAHRRFIEGFSCEVVAFAAGHGICLTAERGAITTYAAKLFDETFKHPITIPLQGIPSRCRVSPDGRTAALTVFITGHAYTSPHFSTQTLLLDAASGKVLANIEEFAVTREGRPFKAPDFNFWGVAFTPDSKNFYCTLNTNGVSYLIKGDIASRTAAVLRSNVECPSLSPDGARIAYKKPLPGKRISWRLQVLDVASMKETALTETRSVDDQLQWLDNRSVLYAVSENPGGSSASTDVWLARVDVDAAPALFLSKAYSPAVVR